MNQHVKRSTFVTQERQAATPRGVVRQSSTHLRKPKSACGKRAVHHATHHETRLEPELQKWLKEASRAAGRITYETWQRRATKMGGCAPLSLHTFHTCPTDKRRNWKQHRKDDARSPLLRQRRCAHRKHASSSIVAWSNPHQAFSCGNLWHGFARVHCWSYVSCPPCCPPPLPCSLASFPCFRSTHGD